MSASRTETFIVSAFFILCGGVLLVPFLAIATLTAGMVAVSAVSPTIMDKLGGARSLAVSELLEEFGVGLHGSEQLGVESSNFVA